MAGIKEDQWFKRRYTPVNPVEDKEATCIDDESLTIHESASSEKDADSSTLINAFELIGMSSSLDLSGFFEKEDVSERRMRFTSHHSPKELMERIEDIVTQMGFVVQKRNGKLKVVELHKDRNSPVNLSVAAEVFEISPSLYLVEVRKSCGDAKLYRQLCEKLSHDLGVPRSQKLLNTEFLV
ncbi:NAF domain-containing protein [Heracleum sosnowskyi]|uniref:non-specific serine/threonine protein kinase n=1 Tax=Heracleum sosnowskyi TaxID=360622 RepID=A0AAD8MUS1_9APIA|nr:NAF domain-containing protein [Heracleum sosnowskyi]